MNKRQTKKMKLIIATLLVILVFILFFVYLYYHKSDNFSNSSDLSSSNNIINFDIDDDKIINLYRYIPGDVDIGDFPANAYQNSLVTSNDLDSSVLLAHAYIQTDIPISERIVDDQNEFEFDIYNSFKALPNRLQETVEQFYNRSIENASFSLYGYSASYEDGFYNFTVEIDNLNECAAPITKIEKAYSIGDELYIIDSYLQCKEFFDTEKITVELFDSSVAENSKFSDSVVITEDPLFDIEKYILNNYFDENSKMYKHTFKKNSNGEYYWYSSEPYIE